MIPTFISTMLLRPGYRMEGTPPPRDMDQIYDERPDLGFPLLDNEALAIYSVDQDKAISIDDVKVDSDGLLAETIFAVVGITDIQAYTQFKSSDATGGWFHDMLLLECDDLKDQIDAIWSDFAPNFAKVEPGLKIQLAGDIGCWEVEMSQGYFDVYPEIEHINYLGRGIVTIQKP